MFLASFSLSFFPFFSSFFFPLQSFRSKFLGNSQIKDDAQCVEKAWLTGSGGKYEQKNNKKPINHKNLQIRNMALDRVIGKDVDKKKKKKNKTTTSKIANTRSS
ncbi:hypothetical protein BD289DRAFT_52176 [Coniella lustricola]|uniref:Uncharacterized protein n=1 Tax=Coniella lustricola TaxID=2025994 RepID=A0A2T3A106_9PEZI|nr:hypothetical protein BD289DRAFT_52176 [Coniella lustricola]